MKVNLILGMSNLKTAINSEIGQLAERLELSTKPNLYSYDSVTTYISTVAPQVATVNKYSSLGRCQFCLDHFAINCTKFNSP